MRTKPNILVTGTPGVGKSSVSEAIAERTGMDHINVAELIKNEQLYSEWDEDNQCSIFDEDRVEDRLSELVADGNKIVDFHSCDFMQPSWFDAVFVLRSDTDVLYDRLEARKYTTEKIQENVQCEIFQILLEEAVDTFGEAAVVELLNNNSQDFSGNVAKVLNSLAKWNPGG